MVFLRVMNFQSAMGLFFRNGGSRNLGLSKCGLKTDWMSVVKCQTLGVNPIKNCVRNTYSNPRHCYSIT